MFVLLSAQGAMLCGDLATATAVSNDNNNMELVLVLNSSASDYSSVLTL